MNTAHPADRLPRARRWVAIALVLAFVAAAAVGFMRPTKYFRSKLDFVLPHFGVPADGDSPGAQLFKKGILSDVLNDPALSPKLVPDNNPLTRALALESLARVVHFEAKGEFGATVVCFNRDRMLAAQIAAKAATILQKMEFEMRSTARSRDMAEMKAELDTRRAETTGHSSRAAELRKMYGLIDSEPETTGGEISAAADADKVTTNNQRNEYVEAKARYLSSRALLAHLEQRYAAEKFEATTPSVRPLPITALPDLDPRPTHFLPGSEESNALRMYFHILTGLAAGLGLAFAILIAISPSARADAA